MTPAMLHPSRCQRQAAVPARRGQDSDRVLILTLAVILVQNSAPLELILALLYAAM